MRHPPILAFSLAIALGLLSACGAKRRFGDEGGAPVAFHVVLDRAFVSEMRNRQGRVGVGVGAGMSSGGGTSIGTGLGLSFSATTVSLVGGDGPGEGQVFRKDLEWGDNDFTVPLAPGRTLHLTVQVHGGREGWEAIGSVVVPRGADPRITATLAESGPTLGVSPAPTVETTTTTTTSGPAAPVTAP
jgi:hypothetical protein